MPTVANIGVSVTARVNKFSAGMKRAGNALFGFRKSTRKTRIATRALSGALTRLAGAFGAIAIGRGLFNMARRLEELDRALLRSQAIMGKVSDSMRNEMRNAAIEMARTTTFSAQEAGKAFFFLASAGLTARQSLAALPLVTKFAEAGQFDLALATDLVTDAQSALGLTVKNVAQNLKNMTRVADALTKANTLANATVEQFSRALTTKAAAAMRAYGISVEEGLAVLAAWADQGIKAQDAGTALNIVLRDLTTKALKNAQAFKKYGIAVFDAQGEIRNLADILRDMEDSMAGASDSTKKLTLLNLGFADKSVIFIQSILGMSERIRGYEDALKSAAGTTENVFAKSLTPLQKSMAEFNALMLEISDGTLPAFIEGLSNAAKGVNSVFQNIVKISLARGDESLAEYNERLAANERIMARVAKRAAELEDKEREVADAAKDAADSTNKFNAAIESANTKTLGDFLTKTAKVQENLENLGASETEIAVRRMTEAFEDANAGLRESEFIIPTEAYDQAIQSLQELGKRQMELAKSTDVANAAASRQADLLRKRMTLFEGLRTPMESFQANLNELLEVFKSGAVVGGMDTFNRAVAQLINRLQMAEAKFGGLGRAREIDVGRTALGGVRAGRRQEVHDSQITKLIEIARQQLALDRVKKQLALVT